MAISQHYYGCDDECQKGEWSNRLKGLFQALKAQKETSL